MVWLRGGLDGVVVVLEHPEAVGRMVFRRGSSSGFCRERGWVRCRCMCVCTYVRTFERVRTENTWFSPGGIMSQRHYDQRLHWSPCFLHCIGIYNLLCCSLFHPTSSVKRKHASSQLFPLPFVLKCLPRLFQKLTYEPRRVACVAQAFLRPYNRGCYGGWKGPDRVSFVESWWAWVLLVAGASGGMVGAVGAVDAVNAKLARKTAFRLPLRSGSPSK